MKLQTKKIIAKELLFFLVVLGLGLTFFFCTFPYNLFRNNQIGNLDDAILEKTQLADSLSQSFTLKFQKQKWFFDQYANKFENDPKYNTQEKVWFRLDDLAKNDSIKFRWEKKWSKELVTFNQEIGFTTPEKMKDYIEVNTINIIDSINYKQSLTSNQQKDSLINKKNEIKTKILSFDEQVELGIMTIIIFVIVLFLIRYLFYAVTWSMKILKEKSE